MKKLILTIVLCAFAMVVAGLNVRSMQNRGVKEATVEAEVEDIVGMNKGSRGEISWNVIYKYSYKGKEYQKEVDGVRSKKEKKSGLQLIQIIRMLLLISQEKVLL